MRRAERDQLQRLPLKRTAQRALLGGALALAGAATHSVADAHYEPCRVIDGQDGCLPPEQCTLQDGGTGICVPPPCQKDSDCYLAPLLRCDTRSEPTVCVECFSDGECPAPKTCELDLRSPASYRCVECQLGRPSACRIADAGQRCILEKGRCGCTENADCPTDHFCRRELCVPRPRAEAQGGSNAADASDAATEVTRTAGHGCSSGGEVDAAWIAYPVVVALASRRRPPSARRNRRPL